MKFAMWDTVKGIFHFLEGGFRALFRNRADDGEETEMGTAFDDALSAWCEFKERVKDYEGYSTRIYKCPSGAKTIGYGCNLDSGISKSAADALLNAQLSECRASIVDTRHVEHINEARIQALTNMCFQLGYKSMISFTKMWKAIDEQQWDKAADEMLDSKWFTQTPKRCQDMANVMRTGAWW